MFEDLSGGVRAAAGDEGVGRGDCLSGECDQGSPFLACKKKGLGVGA